MNWALLAAMLLPADEPDPREIQRQCGTEGGLAVHHRPRTARLAVELAKTGRWLVLALADDEPVAERLRREAAAEGQAGLVAVAVPPSPGTIPLADHTANVVVADLGGFPDPAAGIEEVRRVTVPVRGAAFVGRQGRWEKVTKPMPAGFDEWTHFFHGPDGNPVSADSEVRPPDGLRWIAGVRGHDRPGQNEWRLAGGIAASEWNYVIKGREKEPAVVVEARDAFNGTLLWQRFCPQGAPSAKTRTFIMTRERLIRPDETDPQWRLAAYDPRTGHRLLLYEHSFPARGSQWGRPRLEGGHAILDRDALVCTGGGSARCLDATNGKIRWTYSGGSGELYHPVASPELEMIIVGRGGPSPKGLFGGRYPGPTLEAFVGLERSTGRPLWTAELNPRRFDYTDPKGRTKPRDRFHQVTCRGGRLFALFAEDANYDAPSLVVCIDARTGKELWSGDAKPKPESFDGGERFNLFALPDGTLFLYGHGWTRMDQATGKILAWGGFSGIGGNARCDTASATAGLITAGFGNFFDVRQAEPRWTRRDITRGACGGRSTPGYGMTLHQASGCKCFDMIRGQLALYDAPEPRPVEDDRRLLRGPAAGRPPSTPAGPQDWPAYLYDGLRRSWSGAAGPAALRELWRTKVGDPIKLGASIRQDWLMTSLYNGPVTAPTAAAGLVFTAERDAHRLAALEIKSGRERWSFRAGGRITTPPTYHRGRLFFGARDGWVYCLDAATGELAWKFMAAPEPRFITAYGQIESAWPLHGSLPVAAEIVVATAGHHGETDGGVWAWGLDPAGGKIVWRKRLHRPSREWMEFKSGPDGERKVSDTLHPLSRPNAANGRYHPTRVRNDDLPAWDANVVYAANLHIDGATGEHLDPANPAEARGGAPRPRPPAFTERFIRHLERYPHHNMEIEAYGGPHGPGYWSWGNARETASDRLIHDGEALLLTSSIRGKLETGLYYAPSLQEWIKRKADKEKPPAPICELPPIADSLVAAGRTAYVAAEGTPARGFHGQAIPGILLAVSVPDGKVLARLEIDSAVVNNGLAVAGGFLLATCEDGTVRCYGQ